MPARRRVKTSGQRSVVLGHVTKTRWADRWRSEWGTFTADDFTNRWSTSCWRRMSRSAQCPATASSNRSMRHEIYDQYDGIRQAAQAICYRYDRVPAQCRRVGTQSAVRGGPRLAARCRSRYVSLCHKQQQLWRWCVEWLGRAGPAHRARDWHRQGLFDTSRWRPVSDRTRQSRGRASPSARQRIRHGHQTAAAVRMARRGRRPLYGAAQRRRGQSPSCSSTSSADLTN